MSHDDLYCPRIEVWASKTRPFWLKPHDPWAPLTFVRGCPFCGKVHHHGDGGGLCADGTYGHRVAHCGMHSHKRMPSGRWRRGLWLYRHNAEVCEESHCYVLVPASEATIRGEVAP